ncbi:hypothetical protein BO78DRAFT_395345 [Aspergillus sclerotiicarbonarius CBS 121057]|uniref:DUF7721 domain-containing protein n=1 Tax=Aspergillus sclerotiicarbonarius (strain CBS 121057 / IBT 28362) TaxID=1448318 RepID=A0A319EGM2_ASPSB|nr:hypothetical protein BO78DRAFT_395345 [Aspergillus sclerotiicarbonarius CBS 121057]
MSFSNLISSAIEQGLSGGSSGGGNSNYDSEFSSAHSHAQSHHSSYNQGEESYPSQGGSSSGGSSGSDLFSTALGFLSSRKSQYAEQPDVDEEHMVRSHQALYNNQDEGQQHDSKSLGAGAAMQALKMFTSGSGGSSGDKNEFIGMAMAQASKLWDQKSGSGSVAGDKQSAINSAAEMAFKMYMKSQGSGSSGTGGLMSLASKFL